tara:strand:- start:25182 stop:25718 length:537 start_codon:yes stop_codon:yes gene_type:complete
VQPIPIHKDQSGQVAFEFILVVTFALGTIFLFFQLAFNHTDGYLVHYANFMAARTYLTHDNGGNDIGSSIGSAAGVAQEVFESYPLSQFNINADFNVVTFEEGSGLFSGTTAEFEKPTNLFLGIGGGEDAKLLSESLLGKEPVRKTCLQLTCEAMTGDRNVCEGSSDQMDITLYDNGC